MANDARSGQLNSWKEIASYLGRDIRTIQRWEKEEGLPVHRHLHMKRSSVYAFQSELDAWWYGRSAQLTPVAESSLPSDEVRGTVRPVQWWVWISAAVALAGASAGVFLLASQRIKDEPSASALTSYPGRELSPAFSPGGQHVAFSWNGPQQDNFDIYVMQIGTYTPRRVSTDPQKEYSPAWSPDGQSIAFLRDLADGRAAVILIPAWGGPETKLTETAAPPRPFSGSTDIPLSSLSWSPDGRWLLISDRTTADGPFGIFAVAAGTGERKALTAPAAHSMGDFSAVFSPDGTRIVFCRAAVLLVSEIYLLPVSRHLEALDEARPLTSEHRWSIGPAWTPAGNEILYSSGDLQSQQLFRIKAAVNSVPQRLTSIGENGATPVLDPRGGRLIYVQSTHDCDIHRVPAAPEGNGMTQSTGVAQATSGEGNMDYSPDGSRIAFFSNRSGMGEIWISEPDGSNPFQFTHFGKPGAGTPRWSPNGKEIVFDSRTGGSADIWVMSVADKSAPRRLTDDAGTDIVPTWSRDGRWIYFASNRTGRYEVWKVPASGGTAVPVTRQGGGYALESGDGERIYYAKSPVSIGMPGPGVWTVPVDGGEETRVLNSVVSWPNFRVTDKGIFFMREAGETGALPTIEFMAFADRKAHVIARLKKPHCIGMAVSPDGKSILYSQVEQEGSNLMMVENFR